MAFDGIYLSLIKDEIEKLVGGRIDKISQPSSEEIILSLRARGINQKLIFSINPSIPRVHLTDGKAESPLAPPMLCMLMRKKLSSAKLVGVRQLSFDRVLFLTFEARDDFGDLTEISLACEIMSRRSNLIMIDKDGKIIDALKRVSLSLSQERPILPGVSYELPPREERLSPVSFEEDEAIEEISRFSDKLVYEALTKTFEGMSPLTAKEICFLAFGDKDFRVESLGEAERQSLKASLSNFKRAITNSPKPYIVFKKSEEDGIRIDCPVYFSYIPITFLGEGYYNKEQESFSKLLDEFYEKKATSERIKSKSSDLKKLLSVSLERARRKILARERELENANEKDKFKIYGDVLSANLWRVEDGQKSVRLENFYSEEMEEIEIPLNERKSPSQNVAELYKEYKRLSSAQRILTELLEEAREEEKYLLSALDILKRAKSEEELGSLREELFLTGYIKKSVLIKSEKKLIGQSKGKKLKEISPKARFSPKKYISKDGFTIYCGRNNLENDHLTFKTARNSDLWLHVKDIPGSHVIIVSEGREITDLAIEEASIIAVTNSSASRGVKVKVDYAFARFVKKQRGARPGQVIYTDYKTCLAVADEEKLKEMEK